MTLESEVGKFEGLANDVLNLDNRMISCTIIRNPQGATIARVVRSEFQQSLGKPLDGTNGMAAHWGILAFNAMERLDTVRSKAKYLAIAREDNKTLIFPLDESRSLMIILTITNDSEATEMYEMAMRLVSTKY